MDTLDYHSAVVEFLAQPAHIAYVFEIEEQYEQVIDFLHQKFWRTVHDMLHSRISARGKHWSIDLDGEYTEMTSVAIYPPLPCEARALGLSLQQDTNGKSLFSGVCWSNELPGGQDPCTFAHSIPPIATLRKQLESSYPIGDDPWWLRRKDYTREEVPPLREKRACIRLATDNSLETMLVDDLMALFDETNTLIEQANQDMVSAIQQGHLPA